TLVGGAVGVAWGLIFGPWTDGPPSLALSLLVYTSGFAVVGLVLGYVRRPSGSLGAKAGLLTPSAWALVVAPKDRWMSAWLIVLGGSGFMIGFVFGLLVTFIRRRLEG